ncbi:HNH endonuclease signature motif containing protein [Arthrobacter sp. R4-81]
MEGTGAWTAGTGEALESPGGLEAAEALAAVAASVAILGRIIGPDFRGGADGPDADYGQDSDPLRRQLDACLDALAEVARFEAKAAALKVHLVGKYVEAAEAIASPSVTARDATVQEMSTIAELACVLTVSERTAAALLDHARHLTTGLPLTLTALQHGSISWQHARIMCDETGNLDPAGTSALETHFLDPDSPDAARGCHIGELVPSRFRTKARTWRERHHPDSIETRHRKSALDRRLEYTPDHDGMAWLSAYLPAATAAGIWDRTTTAARALQGPTERRTLTQLRADIAATWLLNNTGANSDTRSPGPADIDGAGFGMGVGGGPVGVPSPRAQVLVTVPVLSLLGATDEPAMLDGYGPIPASVARDLVADGADSFHRVLIDPRDGAPLEIGRTSYRIPKSMRQWLRLRDAKCPFPGCHNHSLDNEADHLLAWADGGTTGITNLGQPCRKHHHLKHSTSWTPTQATANQTPGWTAPSGRQYPSEQQDWQPPTWPDHTGLPAPNPDLDLNQHQAQAQAQAQDLAMPMDLDPDPALPMPVDPFPEWQLLPAVETDDWWLSAA